MALFDPALGRICVRIVYDGAAGAGKTTNLRQLAAVFAAQRRAEIVSPFGLRERTLYFDWLELSSGVVGGYPLVCQVISVPGQGALSARRREILAHADGVVVVCDGEAPSLAEYGDLPVVVQANKRDVSHAAFDVPVLEAIATDGTGVLDTFLAILGAVVRDLRTRVEQGLLLPVGAAESADEAVARVAAAPIDRLGAAELLLQEALAELAA